MSSIKTGIEWTDKTWNPTTGCTKVSPGCTHCYAEALTKRFHTNFPNGFQLTLHPARLEEPFKWTKPSRVFVNSMSDLFHEEVPIDFLQEIFDVIRKTPWHIYQILTKRHERLLKLSTEIDFPDNAWIGVSVENNQYSHRVDYLRQARAKVKFLSCEPLLGGLDINLDGIDWVIVGGESGLNYRPINIDWVRELRNKCTSENVAFFFKQVGGRTPKAGGRNLDDQIWEEMPSEWKEHLEIWDKENTRTARAKLKALSQAT